jgi:hypothetical protein
MNISMCPSFSEVFFKKTFACELRINEDLIQNELKINCESIKN